MAHTRKKEKKLLLFFFSPRAAVAVTGAECRCKLVHIPRIYDSLSATINTPIKNVNASSVFVKRKQKHFS